MPPDQDPLPKEKLEIIRQWIDGGLLENSGSKAKKRRGPSLTFTADGGKPAEITMPESVWRVPVQSPHRTAAASAIAASPWAPLVAIAGQRQVTLYHTDTSDLLGILPFPEGIPQVLQFSLDGAYLMVAGGTHASRGVASLYDVKTGDRLLSVGDELDTIFGADINSTLSNIALGGPQKLVRIFDTASGEVLHDLKKHTDWVYCVDYSPDGILVASGDRSGGLHVWEADTGRLYLDLVGHKGAIRGLSWRADSNVLVSASEDGTVKLWEMSAGKQLKSFVAHGGGATGVMMARDGRIVTSGKDKTVKLWKADGNAIATMPAFTEPALEVAISHDGEKIVGGDWNGRTLVWSVADPKQVSELASNPPPLDAQQAALVSRIAELEKGVAAATANQANHQKAVAAATAMHAGLIAKVNEAKTQLAKVTADKVAAEKQLVNLKTQHAGEATKLNQVRQQVATLSKQIGGATPQIQVQQKLVTDSTARRDAANKQKELVNAAITKAKAEHDQLKTTAVVALGEATKREMDVAAKMQLVSGREAKAEADRVAAAAKVATLNQQLTVVDQTINQYNVQLNGSKSALAAANATLAQVTPKLTEAKKLVQTKTGEIAGLQKQIAKSTDENQKKSLGQTLVQKQAELAIANTGVTNLQKQLADANANKLAQGKLANELPAKIASATTQKQQLIAQRDVSQKQVNTSLAARDVATKEKAAIAQEHAKINAEVAMATKAKDDAVSRMAGLVQQQSQLAGQLTSHTGNANSQEAARAAAAAKVAELSKNVATWKTMLASSQSQQQALTMKVTDLASKLKNQPGAVAKLVAQEKQLVASVPNLEKQVAGAKTKLDASNAALASAKTALVSVQGKLARSKTALESLESELVDFGSYEERLAAEIAATAAAAKEKVNLIAPVATNAEKVAASMAGRTAQMNQLNETLKKIQTQVAELQKAQVADQQSLNAAQAKLNELKQAAEDAEAEMESKKAKAEFFKSVYGK